MVAVTPGIAAALTVLAVVAGLAASPARAQSGRGLSGSVLIGNPESAPVPTRDVDQAARDRPACPAPAARRR
jgi:hypothetical protein